MKNKYYFILIFSIVFTGCATQVSYVPKTNISVEDAVQVIEQVIYEQPKKHRPESVVFTDKFIGFDEGAEYRQSGNSIGVVLSGSNTAIGGGSSKGSIKNVSKRIYYNSMNKINLYEGNWFVIQIIDQDGYRIHKIYTRSETKAKKVIDALSVLKNKYAL